MDHDPQNKPGPFAPASAHLCARARRSRRRARNGRRRARLLAGAAADTTAERSAAADCAASGRRAPEHARRRSRPRRRACGRYRSAGPADGDGPAAGRTGSRRAGGDPQASGRRDHRPHARSPRTHAALQGDRRIDSAVRRRRREARGRGRLYRLYRRRCGGRTPGDLRFQRRAGRGIGLSQYRRARALAAAVRSHHRIGVRRARSQRGDLARFHRSRFHRSARDGLQPAGRRRRGAAQHLVGRRGRRCARRLHPQMDRPERAPGRAEIPRRRELRRHARAEGRARARTAPGRRRARARARFRRCSISRAWGNAGMRPCPMSPICRRWRRPRAN